MMAPAAFASFAASSAGRVVRQADAAEVQDGRVRDEALRDGGPLKADVRAGPAVERETPLAVRVDRDDGQRRRDGLVGDEPRRVDAVFLERLSQAVAKRVGADAADEGGLRPEPGRGHRDVGRGPAGIGGQSADASLVDAGLGEVDEDFTDGHDIDVSRSNCHNRSLS